MQVTIENITDCKRRVTIEIPADEIQQKQEQKIKEFKGARVKGFRPGKAPIDVVLNQIFGSRRQFRASVVESLLQEKFSAAVDEHEIDLADTPELDELNDSGEGNVTFSTICDVYPNFELIDFSSLDLTKRELALTEEEYTKQLDGILKIHGTWHLSEDNSYHAKDGDRVKVAFTPLNDDGSKDAAAEESVEIMLDDKVVYGFEKGLLGMRVNESKVIDKFEVTLHAISTCTKAEPNDELATKLGIHCSHDIRGYVEEKLNAYVADVDLKKVRVLLLNTFVEKYSDLPLPDKLLERYKVAMNKGEFNAANMGPAGISPDEQVRRAVILDLLRARISKKFNLKIDEERVIELITRLALSTFGNYDLVLELYSKNPVLLNQVRTLVLDEQITKLALEHAKLNIEKVSLAEIESLDEEPLN